MAGANKGATQLIQEIKDIHGVEEIFIVGRDGFVVETSGIQDNLDIDKIGATIAETVSKFLELESDLKADRFKQMYVEFEKKIIIIMTVKDLFLAVSSSNIQSLATIKFKVKNLLPEEIDF